MKINNGRRVQLAFGEGSRRVEVTAGLQDAGDDVRLAFSRPARPFINPSVVTIDGQTATVVAVEESSFSAGKVIFTVEFAA